MCSFIQLGTILFILYCIFYFILCTLGHGGPVLQDGALFLLSGLPAVAHLVTQPTSFSISMVCPNIIEEFCLLLSSSEESVAY